MVERQGLHTRCDEKQKRSSQPLKEEKHDGIGYGSEGGSWYEDGCMESWTKFERTDQARKRPNLRVPRGEYITGLYTPYHGTHTPYRDTYHPIGIDTPQLWTLYSACVFVFASPSSSDYSDWRNFSDMKTHC